jgi:hypothetical protein
MVRLFKKLKSLSIIYLSLEIKNQVKTKLQFMKIIRDIGMFQNRKNQENLKVSYSDLNLFNLSLMIFKILYKAKNGIPKWVFHIREAIFCMVHQELENHLSLKQLLHKLIIQYALSIAQIKLMISTLTDY